MASVDVGVGLLGYGTVGSAVSRMLAESGDEIERATGHRLTVVRALVREPARERGFAPGDGVLTDDFAQLRDDPRVDVVAEVMGGLEPAGGYVRELLRAGKPVVSANKQLVAREGAELFALASDAGVQLRFEASVCAAVPVVKVLRESLVAENVHRILGIVNGTTNFVLSRMERGGTYAEALAEAQALGFAEADPADDVSGADAAAKMAILATVAFGSRVLLDDVECRGIESVEPAHVSAAAGFGMAVKLIGIATFAGAAVDVRVQPAFVEQGHPLAGVEGSSNAVVLQATRSARSRSAGRAPAGSRRHPQSSPTSSASSARPARAFSRTTPVGASCRGSIRPAGAHRSTCISTSPTSRVCSPMLRQPSPSMGSRSRGSSSSSSLAVPPSISCCTMR